MKMLINRTSLLQINDIAYRHVIGLGTQCWTATMLRDGGYRKYTGPFDWLFISPEILIHCFRLGMGDILNRSQYVNDGHPHGWRHALFTYRYGFGRLFAHHDMSDDREYERFKRAVERLEAVLNGHDRALFVLMIPDQLSELSVVEPLSQAIAHAMPNSRLVVIGLVHPEPGQTRSVTFDLRTDHMDRCHVIAESDKPNGLSFDDDQDNEMIRRILHRYPIDLLGDPLQR